MSAKPRETANVGAGLWKATGMWAWLLFRISGLILVFYLGAHIIIISMGQVGADGETFNRLHEDLRSSDRRHSRSGSWWWPFSITP